MSGRNFWFPCVVSSVFLAAVAAENAFGQRLQYVASDLGSFLAGGTSSAAGINNLGHVVGVADSSGYGNAFLYSGGSLQDLGTLGGEASSATSINNAGQVVGEALTSSGAAQAFLYSGGTMQNLGTLLATAASCATGINNLEAGRGMRRPTSVPLQQRFDAEPGHALDALQHYECSQRHQ